jgi:hypothetical protein
MKNEIADEVIIGCGFRRHGDHSSNVAAGRGRTEQDFGIFFEQGSTFAHCRRAAGSTEVCVCGPSELIEQRDHGIQRPDDGRFVASLKRKLFSNREYAWGSSRSQTERLSRM